jgi:hypothetical protein
MLYYIPPLFYCFITMISWREARAPMLVLLLMAAVVAMYVGYQLRDMQLPDVAGLVRNLIKPTPPDVDGASSIKRPLANPVVRIQQPAVSVFARPLAASDQSLGRPPLVPQFGRELARVAGRSDQSVLRFGECGHSLKCVP